MFSYAKEFAPATAAVRGFIVLMYDYLYHSKVWSMPISGNRPHCWLAPYYALL